MEMSQKRSVLFVGITFLLTYAVEFLVILPMAQSGDANAQMMASALITAVMLLPSIGVLLTRLITKEGFHDALIKPKAFTKHWRIYVLAWFAPTLLTLIGSVLYFLIFPSTFDGNLTLFGLALGASGAELPQDQLQTLMTLQLVQAAFLSPILNFIPCFGEEWGWRGYLLPKLREQLGMLPTLLVSGVLWGMWHAPLVWMGHNYGVGYAGYPFTGFVAMCLFCVFVGAFFSYLTIRADSCLPAVIGHGALNGIGTIGLYFTVDGGDPFIGPGVSGVIGGIGFIVVGVLCALWLMRREKKPT